MVAGTHDEWWQGRMMNAGRDSNMLPPLIGVSTICGVPINHHVFSADELQAKRGKKCRSRTEGPKR